MSLIPTVRTVEALRAEVAAWRRKGLRVGLVPTMGALHEGHLSLVAEGLKRCDRVVASVFVNPTQFGPGEDYAAYPRGEDRDAGLLAGAGCALLYAPTVEAMYPAGFATTVTVSGVTAPLEGAARPTHFAGVATVVAKLLIQAGPDVAIFGEKDFQQLQVIRRMVRDLDLPVEIVGAPTARDDQGLALSSRNAYLSETELSVARRLNIVLRKAASEARTTGDAPAAAARAAGSLTDLGFAVDYVVIADPGTLETLPAGPIERPARILAAARLGRTRLIDNLPV